MYFTLYYVYIIILFYYLYFNIFSFLWLLFSLLLFYRAWAVLYLYFLNVFFVLKVMVGKLFDVHHIFKVLGGKKKLNFVPSHCIKDLSSTPVWCFHDRRLLCTRVFCSSRQTWTAGQVYSSSAAGFLKVEQRDIWHQAADICAGWFQWCIQMHVDPSGPSNASTVYHHMTWAQHLTQTSKCFFKLLLNILLFRIWHHFVPNSG